MINSIQQSDNNISMQSRFRLFSRRYSTHTPKMRPFPEGYFMRKSPFAKDYVEPQKINIFQSFGKNIRKALSKIYNKILKFDYDIRFLR